MSGRKHNRERDSIRRSERRPSVESQTSQDYIQSSDVEAPLPVESPNIASCRSDSSDHLNVHSIDDCRRVLHAIVDRFCDAEETDDFISVPDGWEPYERCPPEKRDLFILGLHILASVAVPELGHHIVKFSNYPARQFTIKVRKSENREDD